MSQLKPINLRISEKLRDRDYRAEFFAGNARDGIAYQIKMMRGRAGMSQADVAGMSGVNLSTISRIERAGYSTWSFEHLLRIANTLDVRARIVLEPAKDVISQYEKMEAENEPQGR